MAGFGREAGSLSKKTDEVLAGQKPGLVECFKKRNDIITNDSPVEALQTLSNYTAPALVRQRRVLPACLMKSVVQKGQIGVRPVSITQIPQKIIPIPAFGVATLQQCVKLAGQEGSAVVVLQMKHDMPPDDRRLQPGAQRRAGGPLPLDAEKRPPLAP